MVSLYILLVDQIFHDIDLHYLVSSMDLLSSFSDTLGIGKRYSFLFTRAKVPERGFAGFDLSPRNAS